MSNLHSFGVVTGVLHGNQWDGPLQDVKDFWDLQRKSVEFKQAQPPHQRGKFKEIFWESLQPTDRHANNQYRKWRWRFWKGSEHAGIRKHVIGAGHSSSRLARCDIGNGGVARSDKRDCKELIMERLLWDYCLNWN